MSLLSDTVLHLMSAVGQEDDQLLVQQDSSNSSFPGTDGGQIARCIHNSLNVFNAFTSSLCWSRPEAENMNTKRYINNLITCGSQPPTRAPRILTPW